MSIPPAKPHGPEPTDSPPPAVRRHGYAHLVAEILAATGLIEPEELAHARRRAGNGSLASALAEERGFTLIEMLTVLVILGVVLAAIGGVFVSSVRAEVDQNLRFQAQQEARLALDQLRREGHCARELVPVGPTRVTLSFGAYCRSGATVPFTVTWCAAPGPTPSRWTLRRIEPALADAAACAGGKQVADHLVSGNVFAVNAASATRLATLGVSFTTSVDGSSRVYRLRDDIVLRNTARQ